MDLSYLDIIPECNADTNLVQTLMEMKGANHQKSCGQVTNEMQTRFKDSFAIGIIDLDKKQSSYSKESTKIASSNEFSVCKHSNSHHYLIKIHNILENFVISSAKEVGIDVSDLGFPLERDELMKMTKKKEAKNNPLLTKLFKKIRSSTEMSLLSETLSYLHTNKYSVNEDYIRSLFEKYGFDQ